MLTGECSAAANIYTKLNLQQDCSTSPAAWRDKIMTKMQNKSIKFEQFA